MVNKWITLPAAVLCAGSLLLSACNDGSPVSVSSAQPAPTTAPVPAPTPKSEESALTAPLTGLPVKQKVDKRPMMVMINNQSQARPQSGLTHADVLYEVLAEAEITRLVALFQSNKADEPVGPVRSIRPYFIEIGKMYDAIPVHAGGSPDAYAMLQNENIQDIDEIANAGAYFWRESFRKAPHNLYTRLSKLDAGAAKLGYRQTLKSAASPVFAQVKETPSGEPAAKAEITFLLKNYTVSYKYEPSNGTYKRSINGEPHIDLNNKQQLDTKNVIILGAEHKVLDNEGRREVKLTGTGPAYVLQQGRLIKGEWQRSKENELFKLKKDGKEIPLLPGKSHYLIVPDNPSFESHVKITADQ